MRNLLAGVVLSMPYDFHRKEGVPIRTLDGGHTSSIDEVLGHLAPWNSPFQLPKPIVILGSFPTREPTAS